MDAVSDVKAKLSIEDVVSEYVQLKRAGHNFKGLSPFSSERTPSLIVSPDKQIWKDFSSGKGGSVFDFIMEVEGLDFKEALELLARKAGIELDQYRSTSQPKGPKKQRLYDLLELSTKFYQVQFSQSKIALDYVLKKRKFDKQTALDWRLGYSPNNGSALIKFANTKGFNDEEIKAAGLSSKSYRGSDSDMFRGRLMVPLQDAEGRVIGFTARMLDENVNAPKYINTPSTVLYDKSRHVYGLHLAKESIRKSTFAVLVEGNLDVIASHQANVKQVVATAGTALTEQHLKTLSRFTSDIRLSFDADKAGIAATERAIPIASKVDVSLSIISIEGAKDPDELIMKDPKLWQTAVQTHKYALDWLMDRYEEQLDIKTAEGKRRYSDVLLPVVRKLSDPVEMDHYMNQIAAKIDVSVDALNQKMTKNPEEAKAELKKVKEDTHKVAPVDMEYKKVEDRFLSLVMTRQTLREFLNDTVFEQMFTSEVPKILFKTLKEKPTIEYNELEGMKNLSDYVKIESLLYDELYHGLELNELHIEVTRLQAELVTRFIKNEKAKLVRALRDTTDEAVVRSLQEKDKSYNLLLNRVKGVANG